MFPTFHENVTNEHITNSHPSNITNSYPSSYEVAWERIQKYTRIMRTYSGREWNTFWHVEVIYAWLAETRVIYMTWIIYMTQEHILWHDDSLQRLTEACLYLCEMRTHSKVSTWHRSTVWSGALSDVTWIIDINMRTHSLMWKVNTNVMRTHSLIWTDTTSPRIVRGISYQ